MSRTTCDKGHTPGDLIAAATPRLSACHPASPFRSALVGWVSPESLQLCALLSPGRSCRNTGCRRTLKANPRPPRTAGLSWASSLVCRLPTVWALRKGSRGPLCPSFLQMPRPVDLCPRLTWPAPAVSRGSLDLASCLGLRPPHSTLKQIKSSYNFMHECLSVHVQVCGVLVSTQHSMKWSLTLRPTKSFITKEI